MTDHIQMPNDWWAAFWAGGFRASRRSSWCRLASVQCGLSLPRVWRRAPVHTIVNRGPVLGCLYIGPIEKGMRERFGRDARIARLTSHAYPTASSAGTAQSMRHRREGTRPDDQGQRAAPPAA